MLLFFSTGTVRFDEHTSFPILCEVVMKPSLLSISLLFIKLYLELLLVF